MRRRTFLDLLVSGVAGYVVRPPINLAAQLVAWHERLPKVELHLNVRTGVITSVEAHPLRQYFDAGIPVSLNTDDPLFFGNSLAMELASAQRAHHFTRDEIRRLMLSTIDATWLSAERKNQLAAGFSAIRIGTKKPAPSSCAPPATNAAE